MTGRPRLVVFDVDGTLTDSQGLIVAAMTDAFSAVALDVPTRTDILGIVGLSLPQAMAQLAPASGEAAQGALVAQYKAAYMARRTAGGSAETAPFYPGARDLLDSLRTEPETLLGIATGKSRRGLGHVLDGHGLDRHFVTRQTADDHPSKPHPSMLMAAMGDCGLGPRDAVMIGDTGFDIEMAHAAGMAAIGVTWGYHPPERLGAADWLVRDYAELGAVLAEWKGQAA
jgi:phosphoglycolate phosphatase